MAKAKTYVVAKAKTKTKAQHAAECGKPGWRGRKPRRGRAARVREEGG